MTTHLTRVEIDAQDHRDVFDAQVESGARWNGFAIPYFDLPTVHRLADWVGRTNPDYCTILLDSDGVTVIVVQSDGEGRDDETGEYVEVERVIPSAAGLYCIGGWQWTWQEVPEGAPTDPTQLDAWLAHRTEIGAVYCEAANAYNARRIAEGRPFDADTRREQNEAGNAAVAAYEAATR